MAWDPVRERERVARLTSIVVPREDVEGFRVVAEYVKELAVRVF